jgi:spore coat polysaccharide biosynthesis predicted glycosyltransferase SpsG
MTPFAPTPILRVLVACRGSTRDGLGHVMRSRTVARQLALRSCVRMVVVGDGYVECLLAGRDLHYEVHADEREILAACERFQPQVVVLDMLSIPPVVLAALRQRAMLVSLSPVFSGLSAMDMVFHRTVHLGADWHFDDAVPPELRCGLEYAVVRENCVRIPEEIYCRTLEQDPLSIVISMGGTDAGNKTLQALEAIAQVRSRLLIWALLGEGYAHSYQPLVECVQQNQRHEIILAKTSDSMWRVMQSCALAVLAGGTITYEAAYAGLPSINVFEDASHLYLVRELVERGIGISAGYPLPDAFDVAAANIAHLDRSRGELLAMHKSSHSAIDGQGCTRIADELTQYYWSQFRSRHPDRQPRSHPATGDQPHAALRAA